MTQFIVQYDSSTLASVADRLEHQKLPLPTWKLEFPAQKMVQILADRVEKIGEVNIHTGLSILTVIDSPTRQDAETDAKNFCEHLLNLISYSTLAFCGAARLASVLELRRSPHQPFRAYAYPFDKGEGMRSIVRIVEQEFREVFESFNGNVNQERVARAMSWLRKGVNEQETVDEFAAYWVGLEVMKSILRRMLKMQARDPDEWDGVKDVYENELQLANFKNVIEARNKLLHGYERLTEEFINEINGYIEFTRKTLVTAIARVLGLPNATRVSLRSKRVRRSGQRPWSVVHGEIENLPQDLNEILANSPRIEADVEPTYDISNDGQLITRINVTHHFSGPQNLVWHLKGTELWGDNDAGIIKVEGEQL